ncbi:hypothetical protein QEZ40_000513 [Streptomyces katrae]|uniref:Uncharacterized protein n=1 Tax=Streptomyces katrae TaxID=68223 RepID=A0ABT7GTD6_9ACTN|nr:hypothetical protein [Streptomyces katrae]MDK9496170.1 hypothetical protein [Streptomyces katrae]
MLGLDHLKRGQQPVGAAVLVLPGDVAAFGAEEPFQDAELAVRLGHRQDDQLNPVASCPVQSRHGAGLGRVGQGQLHHYVQPGGARVCLDLRLPPAGHRPYPGAGRPYVPFQQRLVLPVGLLVEIAADPDRSSPALEHVVDDVGSRGLAAAGRTGDDHDDWPVLRDGTGGPCRQQDVGQDLAYLRL